MSHPIKRGFRPVYFPVIKTYVINPQYRYVDISGENKLKGFSFNANCNGFIVTNPKKSFAWAYQLGLGWSSNNGDIYKWFYSFFDPSSYCINSFKQNYNRLSRKDALFYTKLILSYFRGLLKGGIVDRIKIINDWITFRYTTINKFALDPSSIPQNL